MEILAIEIPRYTLMPFLSTQTYRAVAHQHGIVEPFDEDCITQGAYELSLGGEAYSTSESTKTHLRSMTEGLSPQISIHPGHFALLLTEEEIHLPDKYIGFISIRNSWKTRGLVNVSGFHVDPGYRGKLKFAVYNAGANTITLTRGERIFPLWLAELDQETEDPYPDPAEHDLRRRGTITSSDVDRIYGNLASPSDNKREIDALRSRVNILLTIALPLLATMIGFLIKNLN